jgi:GNAT superfamily N-acetyltransferase
VTYRKASLDDCRLLAHLNAQLIQDERHRNAMNVAQLESRMHQWLSSGEYTAILWEDAQECVAYALFRDSSGEVHLRQFFVVRHRRREGIGREAMRTLFENVWPRDKRWTVSVLVANQPAVAFWRALGYLDYDFTLEIMPHWSPLQRRSSVHCRVLPETPERHLRIHSTDPYG